MGDCVVYLGLMMMLLAITCVSGVEPYYGEIRLGSYNFAPKGWALCNGQLLPINQNQALFALLGTTYGGDGAVNFALPDLRGRAVMHLGNGHVLGEKGGVEMVTLTTSQMPSHSHSQQSSSSFAVNTNPTSNIFAKTTLLKAYTSSAPNVAMASSSLGSLGGSQAHENRPPYLVSFI